MSPVSKKYQLILLKIDILSPFS